MQECLKQFERAPQCAASFAPFYSPFICCYLHNVWSHEVEKSGGGETTYSRGHGHGQLKVTGGSIRFGGSRRSAMGLTGASGFSTGHGQGQLVVAGDNSRSSRSQRGAMGLTCTNGLSRGRGRGQLVFAGDNIRSRCCGQDSVVYAGGRGALALTDADVIPREHGHRAVRVNASEMVRPSWRNLPADSPGRFDGVMTLLLRIGWTTVVTLKKIGSWRKNSKGPVG